METSSEARQAWRSSWGGQWPWCHLLDLLSMCAEDAAANADSKTVFLFSLMRENHAMVLATALSRVTPPYTTEKHLPSPRELCLS